jgi:hypothetical protein
VDLGHVDDYGSTAQAASTTGRGVVVPEREEAYVVDLSTISRGEREVAAEDGSRA